MHSPMKPIRRQPLAEQTAAHLIQRLRSGQWAGTLPGVNRLASELDVSRETVRAALRQLRCHWQNYAGEQQGNDGFHVF